MKKYHQTAQDREDESRGMKRYEREDRMDTSFSSMLTEDKSEPANLPQHIVHKYYTKCEYFRGSHLDDSIKGLDDTRDDDIRLMEKHESNTKY